jgi:hypothetical protein
LLQEFRAFGNKGHTFSNGDGQVINRAYDLGREWATPNDANEKVPMIAQLDEKRWHLWEMAKIDLKRHKNGTRILRTSLNVR